MAYEVCKFGRYGSKMKGILLEEQSTSAISLLREKKLGLLFLNNRPPPTTTFLSLALIGPEYLEKESKF
jgi:hypothetical protein